MVEQSTAASHSLSQDALSLQASVAQFKVGTRGAATTLLGVTHPARRLSRRSARTE
jgi:methyl-accepting chemotaxis protein